MLAAIPPITLQGTDYLTYFVAPYGSPSPSLDHGVGTLPRKGSTNFFAAGTVSTSGNTVDATFTLTSSGHTDKSATVTYVPNGVAGVPYPGAAQAVPGRVEAENFDNGGEGVAYHDLDAANFGGGYRPGGGVDIFADASSSNGFGVGWVNAGEWLEFSVNVTIPACYQLDVRAATPYGGSLFLQQDGVDVSGEIVVPNTGGYANWQTVPVSGVVLTPGLHRLRLVTLSDNVNLDYLQFSKLGNRSPTARAGGPYTTIENVGRTLRGSQSSDPDQPCGDSITKYEWDLNNDGTFSVLCSRRDPLLVRDRRADLRRLVRRGGAVSPGLARDRWLRTDGHGYHDLHGGSEVCRAE